MVDIPALLFSADTIWLLHCWLIADLLLCSHIVISLYPCGDMAAHFVVGPIHHSFGAPTRPTRFGLLFVVEDLLEFVFFVAGVNTC